MYPGHWAEVKPDAAAVIHAATGETVDWRTLDARSNQIAQLLHSCGLRAGDHVCLLMQNHLRYFDISWGALRAGLYLTCINRYLTPEEAAYIANDSGAKVLIASAAVCDLAELAAETPEVAHRFAFDTPTPGWTALDDALRGIPDTPLAEQPMGDTMLYSSGSTGRPKGIKRPLTGKTIHDGIPGVERANPYGINDQTRYLSPAPLYHAAPFGFCMRTLSLGGTVVMMEKFDATDALRHIEHYQITHSQWVPTMFVRMLKLSEAERARFDLSSHTCAIHAAAPCPVAIKQQMMDWWGPILWEYYAGTERNGATIISPEEWLAHPGSVGRASSGTIHICDEEGKELATGEAGLVYFEQPARPFEYHNDPGKTSNATHPAHSGWTSLGDVGYLDEAGYLYLTDRKAFMIISGGVNIYPREIEDALILHPLVADVGVFGVPDAEFGEAVKAAIQPAPGVHPDDNLTSDLLGFAREHLASYKVPKSIDYHVELPRLPTGKLYKRALRDPYWEGQNS